MKLKTIQLSLLLLLNTSVFADNNENCLISADVELRGALLFDRSRQSHSRGQVNVSIQALVKLNLWVR
jgi:hypothetical protein